VARISDGELARLKAEVSLVRLVEAKGIALAKHGANGDLVGCCPFHDDRSPSFVVSPSKNLWRCHGACQTGGSVIDFVMRVEAVSFRHAVDLLRQGVMSGPVEGLPPKRSTSVKLPPLAEPSVEDRELLGRVVGFYADTLVESPEVLAYLARRRIDNAEALEVFRLGYANRTLGYRLPHSSLVAGAELRGRLQQLGVIRQSGHEHFRGSLVIPVVNAGEVTEIYGRKIRDDLRAGTPVHLYLPGPHRGVWNLDAFAVSDELIVCESLIDALSLWCWGFRHVTAAYGVEGFTADHWTAIDTHRTKRVLLAFDGDEAGDKAARRLARQLLDRGVEVFRVGLPTGADINDVVRAAKQPTDELGRLLRKASWMGAGVAPTRRTPAPVVEQPVVEQPVAEPAAVEPVVVELAAGGESLEELQALAAWLFTPEGGFVEPPVVDARLGPHADDREAGSFAADAVSPVGPVDAPSVSPAVEPQGPPVTIDDRELVVVFGERRWRVRGLHKVSSFDLLRVNVLVGVGDRFHVDTLDLYSARARQAFTLTAAAELGLDEGVVKRDLGRVLLACETHAETVIAQAQAPKTTEVVLSDSDRRAALELLCDPLLVERIAADFTEVGVVGEATNCLVGYLAALSRKLDQPLAVIIQSTSAAGKSALMDAVLGLVPAEERVKFSAMTGQSLFYMGEADLAHKVLAIAEEEGASRAAYALKLLQSEGELSIASTGKDNASGRLITHTYSVQGPTAIMLTTTAIDIDEELLNRCMVLTVDEGAAQTRAIHDRQRAKHTLDGLLASDSRERLIVLHQNAQRLLEPVAVVNPFADRLTFADGSTRTRRDHVKYLTLIRVIALLHQHQRTRKTATTGDGRTIVYIEATLADIGLANRLANDVLGQTLDELPPQTRRLLVVLDGVVAGEAKLREVDRQQVRFTRRQLREQLGWGDTQLKVHLARLVDLELVIGHRADGGGTGLVYELAWSGEGVDGRRFMIGLTAPAQLESTSTADSQSGSHRMRSGAGRPPVGPVSGHSRTDLDGTSDVLNGHNPTPNDTGQHEHAVPDTSEHADVVVGRAS
jgi:DNA primase